MLVRLLSTDLQDMIRFNEAIDQAIVQSVAAFTQQTDQARNFFWECLGTTCAARSVRFSFRPGI